jgi:hypothetical protein
MPRLLFFFSDITPSLTTVAIPPNPFTGGNYNGDFFLVDARICVSWDFIEKV